VTPALTTPQAVTDLATTFARLSVTTHDGFAKRRLLLMLQAYIDDSKQDALGVYVLAGYISDATKWEEFADEWDTALARPPKLHHLKTSDIFRHRARDSVFYGWTQEETDTKLLELAKTVNRYVLASVQTGIRENDFKNIIGGFGGDPALNRPYPFLFYTIMEGIVGYIDELKLDDKIEFFLILRVTNPKKSFVRASIKPLRCTKDG
jgi:hypothetical protein